jgi:hypothetical protein
VHIEIYDLQFDDGNESEITRHRVRVVEIVQVLDGEPVFLANRKGHSATVVMIGPTYGGRFLTVPLAPTPAVGVWRPATAWDSSDGEKARYRNAQ